VSETEAETQKAAGARDGPDGFVELFHGHAAQLVRLATLLGADDAEDVVQESFCKLYAAWSRIRADNPIPYLHRIVANEVRSRQRRRLTARRYTPPPEPPLGSAEETAIERAEHRLLLEALARLPHRRREALVLRYWLDLTIPQIAEVMGVSPGTVKAQLSRGLRALEKNLRKET
jgi:RNA polymerase sigma-70 factor (sigma-E family)